MDLNKIKDKISLPMVLFFIILINFIPLILPNMISKASHGVGIIPMTICFGIECTILMLYFLRKIEITKEMKKNTLILVSVSAILFIVQIKNFITKEFQIMDTLNIVCQFVNVLLLFIAIMNCKSEEKNVYCFMNAMVIFGVFACLVNMVLYFNEILQTLGIQNGSGKVNIKSFFANRNQFAFFLYVIIIANIFMILKENKLSNKLLLILFGANLILTMSRTGILTVGIFAFIYFLTIDKINKKTKTILLILGIICLIGIVFVVYKLNPNLIKSIGRFERIKDLSGRTNIWARGINLVKEDPINFLFGVGRFKGTEILKFEKRTFSQFHNIYIDSLVTGGILELMFILYIYGYTIRKNLKSNIEKKYKNIYLTMFITFAIYICFESFGRFSIGCSDTLCLIFFVTIPLLHANICSTNGKKEIEGDKI